MKKRRKPLFDLGPWGWWVFLVLPVGLVFMFVIEPFDQWRLERRWRRAQKKKRKRGS